MDIRELLAITVESKASDLHLLAGSAPMIRVDGALYPVKQETKLTPETSRDLVLSLLSPTQKNLLLTNKEIDFSFNFGDRGRFRVNAYFERGRMGAALRLIPNKIKGIEELNLPKICHRFTQLKSGFILVTGPTGHGKSSTLAAIIDEINTKRKEHIITIEDPIEYVYENKESIISQRELNHDTYSWTISLRSALREDPDVVLVGEMRDYETIAAALTIAETGHLVFATLHTNSASQTIDRIVDVFPEHQQAQIRMQLSNSLEAVFSQRLLPALGGGRIPACEVLLATSAVKATIREGKTHLIDNVIQTSQGMGMISLESSLAELVKIGRISREIALAWSLRPKELARLLGEGKT
ncbi:type IV pili twitching motility protein PilT [Candidatus Beckwithbacteria bacterium CG10_big_fil_rev_8_21_14_0_10_34_10]|uniref:Type IV pili twitching motility protein PilT n=1 Tax=Candidatus Beckwithbacteria bacterium CG10_big_fil_rev_8_21_14_0_10_34_10 TaxID=1974495 RepID=A0A2H0WAL2_9BACT|nr:MAG: type IV pili twitching motility protein PilT [Candidatus Beckwithbacteria bacterium CG10_big_fil_rev_8_21_14_0_10_34_10]